MLPAQSHWWYERVGEHFSEVDEAHLVNLGFEPSIMHAPIRGLSSGEKQRLSLLRLLANRPKVLLLDEPTAHLDRSNTQRVEEVLYQYRITSKASMLWVMHDMEQIGRVADRHLEIIDGKVREEVDP